MQEVATSAGYYFQFEVALANILCIKCSILSLKRIEIATALSIATSLKPLDGGRSLYPMALYFLDLDHFFQTSTNCFDYVFSFFALGAV